MRLTRRAAVPCAVLDRLDPEERALAWAVTPDGAAVVATPRGLWLPGEARLPWHLITHVVWSGSRLTVTAAAEVEPSVLENLPPVTVLIPEPATVPQTVQQRFYSSRAHSTRHRLSDGSGVIVVARRVPGQDGLTWYAVYDDPGRRHDPAARVEVEQLLAQARSP